MLPNRTAPPSSSPPPSPKRPAVEAKQGCITAAARAIEFGKTNFYADGGKLFCKSCNVVVNHIRKDTIDKHIKSKKHVEKVLNRSEITENRATRLQTLKTVVNARTDAEYSRKEVAIDLAEALLCANIPLEKLDHPAIRRFIDNRIEGAGSIPQSSSVRRWYLPTIQKAHEDELQHILDTSDGIMLIVDETSDNVTERSVLNILLTPVNATTTTEKVVSYLGDQR